MKTSGKLLYFVFFAALAVAAALGYARVARPSIAAPLAWAALAAALAGGPGLIRRRAWPAALVLLPVGAYLILRAQAPVPAAVHGLGEQYRFYLEQLRSGAHAWVTHTFPLELTGAAGLKLLLSLVVYGATGLASLSALSLRKALPGVVILLALLGFGLTVDGAGRVIVLPLAFLLLAGCLLTLSRCLERRRWAPAGVAAGAATAMIASLLALVLLAATPVAAGRPWQDWSTWGPSGVSPPRLTFDWMLNFPRLLNPKTDAQVMRVESPVASYWRANALDYFSGKSWLSGGSFSSRLTAEGNAAGTAGADTYDIPPGDHAPTGRTVTEVFRVQSLYTDFLFAGGAPTTLVLGRNVPVFTTGVQALRLAQPLGPRFTYALTAVIPQARPAALVARGRRYPLDILPDTMLPFPTAAAVAGAAPQEQWQEMMGDTPADREWLGLYRLNRDIVRGATDPYQITLRIEQYLRSHYTYSLTPPPTRYRSPYAAFLFDTKTGYCQHFAGTMAVLVRFNGIPARVAVGFTTGVLAGRDTYVVRRTDAHAWVEVYFPGIGWVDFDPTPGGNIPGAGPSSTSAGFVDPFRQDRGRHGPTAAGTAAPKLQSLPGGSGGRKPREGPGTSGSPSTTPDWLPWALGLAAGLVAWPFGRAAAHQRGLRRGSPDGRLRASLALVHTELRDYGVSVPRSQTLEETAALLKEYLDLDAASLTDRVEAVLFGGHVADRQDLADVAALRRQVRRRLRARRGWVSAVLASYGLRVAPR
ncbi:MAG: transglutaminase-like domain-containing protein [Thermoleophilia bacterium]